MDFMNIFSISVYLLLTICLRGFAELVRTEQLVMASLGEDVTLKCELTKQKNVKQVTWQRVSEQTSENMATYSERYGSKIAESFRKNVCFVERGLQHCSIVLKRVQWSDESCYSCLFNVFPDGAISGGTCLKIYELHNPIFEVNPVNVGDDRRLSLSCSATGRPAPEVSWSIEDTALENSTTFYTKNPNGTITLSKTAIVQITPRHLADTTQIKCAAQQEFGERKETFVSIPNEDIPSDTRHTALYSVLVIGGLCICGGFCAFVRHCLCKETEHSSPLSPARNTTTDSCQVSISTPKCSQVKTGTPNGSEVNTGLLTGSTLKKRQIHPSEHPTVKKTLNFGEQKH